MLPVTFDKGVMFHNIVLCAAVGMHQEKNWIFMFRPRNSFFRLFYFSFLFDYKSILR